MQKRMETLHELKKEEKIGETMLEEEENENKEISVHKVSYSAMQSTAAGSTPF
jgi:hypothetical protein